MLLFFIEKCQHIILINPSLYICKHHRLNSFCLFEKELQSEQSMGAEIAETLTETDDDDLFGEHTEQLPVSGEKRKAVEASEQVEVPSEKKLKLAADWLRPDVKPIQTISISAAAARCADESSSLKGKDTLIRKRTPRSDMLSGSVGERANSSADGVLPVVGLVLKAKVAYVSDMGVYMTLPKFSVQGLVPNSQLSHNKDIDIKKIFKPYSEHFVKVVKHHSKNSVTLSTKYCDQVNYIAVNLCRQ